VDRPISTTDDGPIVRQRSRLCSKARNILLRATLAMPLAAHDLRVSACQGPTMYYMSTDFGAASSSSVRFRANRNPKLGLVFDLLTSDSEHAKDLLCPLLLLAQAFSFLSVDCGLTHRCE